MVQSGRDCKEILQQIVAATKALNKLSFVFIFSVFKICIEVLRDEEDIKTPMTIDELEKIFIQLG